MRVTGACLASAGPLGQLPGAPLHAHSPSQTPPWPQLTAPGSPWSRQTQTGAQAGAHTSGAGRADGHGGHSASGTLGAQHLGIMATLSPGAPSKPLSHELTLSPAPSPFPSLGTAHSGGKAQFLAPPRPCPQGRAWSRSGPLNTESSQGQC